MLNSMAAMASAKGFARVTVGDVTRHAGVSRRTFYDQFVDKEDCFLAAFDAISDRMQQATEQVLREAGGPWSARVRTALAALLTLLRDEPAYGRVALVEVLSAGPISLQRRDALVDRFAVLFAPQQSPAPSAIGNDRRLARAVVGGVYETLYQRIVGGELERLPDLLPDLVYCVLVPYLGHFGALHERELVVAH